MTHAEFLLEQAKRPCRSCGYKPVVTRVELNNNGTYVFCPQCGKKHAWAPQVMYLAMENKLKREEYPDGHSLQEVWDRYHNHCFVCGLDKGQLTDLKIGRERHHTKRYAEHGHDGGFIIPVCGRCHAFVTAIQAWVRVFLKKLGMPYGAE